MMIVPVSAPRGFAESVSKPYRRAVCLSCATSRPGEDVLSVLVENKYVLVLTALLTGTRSGGTKTIGRQEPTY